MTLLPPSTEGLSLDRRTLPRQKDIHRSLLMAAIAVIVRDRGHGGLNTFDWVAQGSCVCTSYVGIFLCVERMPRGAPLPQRVHTANHRARNRGNPQFRINNRACDSRYINRNRPAHNAISKANYHEKKAREARQQQQYQERLAADVSLSPAIREAAREAAAAAAAAVEQHSSQARAAREEVEELKAAAAAAAAGALGQAAGEPQPQVETAGGALVEDTEEHDHDDGFGRNALGDATITGNPEESNNEGETEPEPNDEHPNSEEPMVEDSDQEGRIEQESSDQDGGGLRFGEAAGLAVESDNDGSGIHDESANESDSIGCPPAASGRRASKGQTRRSKRNGAAKSTRRKEQQADEAARHHARLSTRAATVQKQAASEAHPDDSTDDVILPSDVRGKRLLETLVEGGRRIAEKRTRLCQGSRADRESDDSSEAQEKHEEGNDTEAEEVHTTLPEVEQRDDDDVDFPPPDESESIDDSPPGGYACVDCDNDDNRNGDQDEDGDKDDGDDSSSEDDSNVRAGGGDDDELKGGKNYTVTKLSPAKKSSGRSRRRRRHRSKGNSDDQSSSGDSDATYTSANSSRSKKKRKGARGRRESDSESGSDASTHQRKMAAATMKSRSRRKWEDSDDDDDDDSFALTRTKSTTKKQPRNAAAKGKRANILSPKSPSTLHTILYPEKKSYGAKVSPAANGLRRSTRTRFAPLEYWKGESVDYGHNEDTAKNMPVPKGIRVTNPTDYKGWTQSRPFAPKKNSETPSGADSDSYTPSSDDSTVYEERPSKKYK
jgi:hypothetical protein